MSVTVGDFYAINQGNIPRILQDRQMNCWLYSAIMLKSWQIGSQLNKKNIFNYYSSKRVAGQLDYGARYYNKLAEDQDPDSGGLHFYYPSYESFDDPNNATVATQHKAKVDMAELSGFFKGMGFKKISRPLNNAPSANEWYSFLKSLGPLIVLRLFPAHARVLIGTWSGNGEAADQAIVIDPAFGAERRILMDQFQKEIGSFAGYAGWENTVWYAPQA